MQTKSKIGAYIGFAVKSGKCKTGENTLATVKGARLVIVCKTASFNAVDKARSYAKKFRCPLYQTKEKPLYDYVFKPNVKVMAITDGNLSEAIIGNAEEELIKIEDRDSRRS